MLSPEWNKYIEEVLSFVKFKYDHGEIKIELIEHMTDMYEDLTSDGMDEEEAAHLVCERMGSAEETGKELNKEHSPILGNIYRISIVVLLLSFFISVLPILNIVLSLGYTLIDGYDKKDDAEIVYRVDVNEKAVIDDIHLTVDEVIYYDDSLLEVRYKYWHDFIFGKSIGWTFNLVSRDNTYDENGDTYESAGTSHGGILTKCQTYIYNFPPDAEKLYIDYDNNGRKAFFEIDLGE